MTPQSHLVISWVLSNLNCDKRKDRIVTTVCGVIPDIDGLGLIVVKIFGVEKYYWLELLHHKVGHNIFGVIVIGLIAYCVCERRILPAIIAIIAYLTHIFCDLMGSAASDGGIWPIYFFWPFSLHETTISWQWPLQDWKNVLITAIFIVTMIMITSNKKRSFLEMFSPRFDKHCIDVVEGISKRKTPNKSLNQASTALLRKAKQQG